VKGGLWGGKRSEERKGYQGVKSRDIYYIYGVYRQHNETHQTLSENGGRREGKMGI
jgi:hypothetical protein